MVYVILNATLVSSFICIFFFTYVTDVEKQLFMSQVDRILNSAYDSVKLFLTPQMKSHIIAAIDNRTDQASLEHVDRKIKLSNQKLRNLTYLITFVLVLTGLIVSYHLCVQHNLNFYKILGNNVIILLGIALIEYIFATHIVTRYIYIDSNFVKKTVIDVLLEQN